MRTKARPEAKQDLEPELEEGVIPCFKEELVTRLRKEMPSECVLEDALVLLSAISDRARLKILWAMRDGQELCVCDVSHILKTTISTASHHLRKLRDLKVLKTRYDGKWAYYSLRSELAGDLVADLIKSVRGVHALIQRGAD
jgi:DNA-binding transcriptional ArsR family regulator